MKTTIDISDNNVKVSVIIPVYNVEKYIESCIHSVIEQSLQNIELILIDDCGNDNSIKLAEKLLQTTQHNWKIIHHDHNKGLSAARNTGVKHTTGKYFFFLDSDDSLTPSALELLYQKAETTGAEMTFGNYLNLTDGNLSPGYATRLTHSEPPDDPITAYMNGYAAPVAWNRLVNTEWYRSTKVQFIEGILHEDEPWSLNLIVHAKRLAFVNDITYHYLQRHDSIVHNPQQEIQRAEGRLQFVHTSYNLIHNSDIKKPEIFTACHNLNIYKIINAIKSSHLNNKNKWIDQILNYAWVPNIRTAIKQPIPEMRFFYIFALFLPNLIAYKMAQLTAIPIKIWKRLKQRLNRRHSLEKR